MANFADRGFLSNLRRVIDGGVLTPELVETANRYQLAYTRLYEVLGEARKRNLITQTNDDFFVTAETRVSEQSGPYLTAFEQTGTEEAAMRLTEVLLRATYDAIARRETIETLLLGRSPNAET